MPDDENREAKTDYWLNVAISLITGLLTGIIASAMYVGDFNTVYEGTFIVLLIGAITLAIKYLKGSEIVRKYFVISTASLGAGLITSVVVSAIYAQDDLTAHIGLIAVIIIIIFVTGYVVYINRKILVG
jgi:hypothetical protein